MSARGQGYFSPGFWKIGYWTASLFPERVRMAGRKGFPTATQQPDSLVINDLDDGTQGTGTILDPLKEEGSMKVPTI